jgi:hypothetical protein
MPLPNLRNSSPSPYDSISRSFLSGSDNGSSSYRDKVRDNIQNSPRNPTNPRGSGKIRTNRYDYSNKISLSIKSNENQRRYSGSTNNDDDLKEDSRRFIYYNDTTSGDNQRERNQRFETHCKSINSARSAINDKLNNNNRIRLTRPTYNSTLIISNVNNSTKHNTRPETRPKYESNYNSNNKRFQQTSRMSFNRNGNLELFS